MCATPDCSNAGATTKTAPEGPASSAAIASATFSPGAPMPSSLVTRMRMPVPSSFAAPSRPAVGPASSGGGSPPRRSRVRCREPTGGADAARGTGDRGGRGRDRRPRRRDRRWRSAARGCGSSSRRPSLGEVGAGIQIGAERGRRARGARAARRRGGAGEPAAGGQLVDFRADRPVARLRLGQAAARQAGPTGISTAPTSWPCSRPAPRRRTSRLTLGAAVLGVEPDGAGLRVRTRRRRRRPVRNGGRRGRRALAARAAHLAAAPARFTGHVAWRALVPADRVPAAFLRPEARVTMAPGRHLVSYPLRGGTLVNLVAVEERAGLGRGRLVAARRPGQPAPRLRRLGRPRRRARRRGRGLLALGALRPRAAPLVGRRAPGAPRRRLPPDAAVPGAGGDDGARGRLGARRPARPRPRPGASASPPTRPRGCRGRPGCSGRRRRRAGSTTCAPGCGSPRTQGSAWPPASRPACSRGVSTGSIGTT